MEVIAHSYRQRGNGERSSHGNFVGNQGGLRKDVTYRPVEGELRLQYCDEVKKAAFLVLEEAKVNEVMRRP